MAEDNWANRFARKTVDHLLASYGFDPDEVYGVLERLASHPDLEDIRIEIQTTEPPFEIQAEDRKHQFKSPYEERAIDQYFRDLGAKIGVRFQKPRAAARNFSVDGFSYEAVVMSRRGYDLRVNVSDKKQPNPIENLQAYRDSD